MQKVISAEQTRAADQHTIQNEPISSIELMERASLAFVDQFEKLVHKKEAIVVLCGTGNNGGDGLAIARILSSRQYLVKTLLVKFSSKLSDDCQVNLQRLGDQVEIIEPANFQMPYADVIIDALFGSGLNRPISGELGEVINEMNRSNGRVFSVDVPSGLLADEVNLKGAIIRAHHTITFQRPKLSFLLPETGAYTGQWVSVDIGLNEDFINDQEGDFYLLDEAIKRDIEPRKKFQHKGNFGRVQVFAGSLGKIGAAYLCAKAAFKSGAGLVTAHVPECGMQVLQTNLPEAMLTVDKAYDHISNGKPLENTDVICFGPGVGLHQETATCLRKLLESDIKKWVIDADGLNILKHSGMMDILPEGTILTPHVGEFHRLFGDCADGLERIKVAQHVAFKRKVVIVLKGAHTAVVCPDKKVYFNNTGNPGMATAGSGDVLAGIIAGFLAQGLAPQQAACLGVYVHGEAGDLARKTFGEMSLMASDLLDLVHQAIITSR